MLGWKAHMYSLSSSEHAAYLHKKENMNDFKILFNRIVYGI